MFSKTLACAIIYYFFTRPKRRVLKPWMSEFLNLATKRVHPIKDSSFTSYEWKGPGETILFMHGWKSNSARWKQLVQYFQEQGFNSVSIDAPGHGDTAFPFFTPLDYAECLEISIKEFNPGYIVSHSAGAYTALLHHGKYKPKGIKQILMAPTFSMKQPIGTMFEILGLNDRTQKAFIGHIENKLGAKIETVDIDRQVNSEAPEGILIHDVNDEILPIDGSRLISEKAKGLKFYEIKNKGHRMQNEEVYGIIKGYVNQHS